jgi:peptidoglycan/LPS O-acetylase OafA/YrhL
MKANARNGNSPRIDDIEALRAIAITFTLLTHLPGLFPWGNDFLANQSAYFTFFTGVDLFLAVSGFVIARDLLRRFDSATTSEMWWRTLFAFWIRRAYRIWPTSWLWLFVIVIVDLATPSHIYGDMRKVVSDSAAILMQVANVHWWGCVSGQYECAGVTAVWWTLSLEEQFYIALPFAVLLFRKKLPYFLIAVILAQFFLSRPNWGSSLLYYVKTDALSFGVLIAIFSTKSIYEIAEPKFLNNRIFGVPAVALLVLLLAITSGHGKKIDPVPFSTGLIALISAFLVFIASYDRDYIVRSKALKPLFLWLGSRSFAIYLIHGPMIWITFHMWNRIAPKGTVFGPNYTLRYAATWLALTIILAEANYRLVETPLRKKGRLIAKRMQTGTPAILHNHVANQSELGGAGRLQDTPSSVS